MKTPLFDFVGLILIVGILLYALPPIFEYIHDIAIGLKLIP